MSETARNRKKPAAPGPAAPWRNRIVGYGEADPKTLQANPLNWRVHGDFQRASLGGVLREIGVVQNIVVNRVSGRILDGHLRVEEAVSSNQPTIPITYVELSPAEEAAVLASLDSITSLADQDSERLAATIAAAGDPQDPALALLLDSLSEEASITAMSGDSGESDNRAAGISDRQAAIRAVLYAEEVATFEAALKATGEVNRAEALIIVCREYLEAHAEGQLDVPVESPA